jgi:hypothetical protein
VASVQPISESEARRYLPGSSAPVPASRSSARCGIILLTVDEESAGVARWPKVLPRLQALQAELADETPPIWRAGACATPSCPDGTGAGAHRLCGAGPALPRAGCRAVCAADR